MRHNALLLTGWVLTAVMLGCGTNTVNLVYVPDEHKVILNPKTGMILKWSNPQGNPVPVQFPFGNPCKDAAEPGAGQCTVTVAHARVPYLCDGCADPEIVVGSDISTLGQGNALTGTPTPPTAIVYMACDRNAVSIYPPNVGIPQSLLGAGATVLWTPGGLSPIGPDWKADNFTSPVCSNNPPFNHGNATCNLKTDLAVGTTATYTVSAASCSTGSASGTITIK